MFLKNGESGYEFVERLKSAIFFRKYVVFDHRFLLTRRSRGGRAIYDCGDVSIATALLVRSKEFDARKPESGIVLT